MATSAEAPATKPAAVLVDLDNLAGGHLDLADVRRVADIIRALGQRFEDLVALVLFTSLRVPSELYDALNDAGGAEFAQWVADVLRVEVGNDVDAAITSRAMEELPRVRELVLVSGDGGLAHILTAASRQGVRTVVVADEDRASSLLTSAANEWMTTADLLAGRSGRTDMSHESASTDFVRDTAWSADDSVHVDTVDEPGRQGIDGEAAADENEREHVAWLDDDPVDIGADELGRQGVAEALEDQLRTLVRDYSVRSFLVHIDGPWGAGKSTLMRFVQERVMQRHDGSRPWLVVSYDAWRQSKAGPPWLTLLEAIRSGVRADKTTVAQVWFWLRERARLVALWQWIALTLVALLAVGAFFLYVTADLTLSSWGDVLKLAGGLVSVVAAVWVLAGSIGRFAALNSHRAAKTFVENRADPMEDLAEHFRWVLAEAGRPVLLLIDDLDRCPDSHVVETLETVQKLLRDQSTETSAIGRKPPASLIILAAADGRWIRASYDNTYAGLAKAMSDPGSSIGSQFVQKLFQLTVPVPRLSDALKAQYITDLLSEKRGAFRRPRHAADEELARNIKQATSGEEVLDLLANADPIERIKVADQAIQKLVVDPDAQARTRHVLEPFAALVDPTPRSLKRYVMAYSMLRAVRTAEGSVVGVRKLALWTVLVTRWPILGDYLQRFPESVELFKNRDKRALKDLPPELRSLFTDPPDELQRVIYHDDGPSKAETIRVCTGQ